MSQRTVQLERDIWILMQSVSPKEAAIWIADKLDAISDPEFRAIYLEYDAAFDWSPDDPRLYSLAVRTQRWIANRRGRSEGSESPVLDPTIIQLIVTSFGAISPAWNRLTEFVKQRKTGQWDVLRSHLTSDGRSQTNHLAGRPG